MSRSIWKLPLNASSEESARKLVGRCIALFDRPPIEFSIEKYAKGGYIARIDISHNDNYSWPELVYEVITFGQKLGSGWWLLGNISDESNAVLDMSAGARTTFSGLQWAEWQVANDQALASS